MDCVEAANLDAQRAAWVGAWRAIHILGGEHTHASMLGFRLGGGGAGVGVVN